MPNHAPHKPLAHQRRPQPAPRTGPRGGVAIAWWATLACALSACSLPQAPAPKTDYDLGPQPVSTLKSPLGAPRALLLAATTAPPALGSQEMRYRLTYAQALQPRTYTLARWSMAPAQLVHQRLRRQLAADGWLIGSHNGTTTPALHIELDAFEQVFDTPELSHGLVQMQVSLRSGSATLAQHSIEGRANATSANAAGGAEAMAAATDDALAQLRTWLVQHTAR